MLKLVAKLLHEKFGIVDNFVGFGRQPLGITTSTLQRFQINRELGPCGRLGVHYLECKFALHVLRRAQSQIGEIREGCHNARIDGHAAELEGRMEVVLQNFLKLATERGVTLPVTSVARRPRKIELVSRPPVRTPISNTVSFNRSLTSTGPDSDSRNSRTGALER